MNHDPYSVSAQRRIAGYQSQNIAFVTKVGGEHETLDITYEPENPILRRPRYVITCPPGTPVDDVRTAIGDEALAHQWYAGSGSSHDRNREGRLYA